MARGDPRAGDVLLDRDDVEDLEPLKPNKARARRRIPYRHREIFIEPKLLKANKHKKTTPDLSTADQEGMDGRRRNSSYCPEDGWMLKGGFYRMKSS